MEQSSKKRGIDGTPKSHENHHNLLKNTTSSEIHPLTLKPRPRSTHEPHPKRQKVDPVALLKQAVTAFEEQEKSETDTPSWVDTAREIIKRGVEDSKKARKEELNLMSEALEGLYRLKRLEEEISQVHSDLYDLFYSQVNNGEGMCILGLAKFAVELLMNANQHDTEGRKEVDDLLDEALLKRHS